MKDLISSLRKTATNLLENLDKGFKEDGSVDTKAAIQRARKNTNELTKLGKEFRAESIKAEKGL